MKPEYIDKKTASKLSKRSVRRLLELAAAGRIRKILQQDPETGKGMIALFHRADIERLSKGEQLPVLAGNPPRLPRPGVVAALPPGEPAPIPANPRPWMTLDEAESYSGLPRSFLETICKDGRLRCFDVGPRPGGRWRVAKLSLDAFGAPPRNGR